MKVPPGLRSIFLSSLLLFLVASFVIAQERPAEPPQRFGEEITVRAVSLPIVAHDGRGRPITDLKAGEISVREGNRIYQVESLTRLLDVPEERKNLPRVRLITGLESNRTEVTETTSAEPRHMIVVVDVENDPPLQKNRAMDALKRFLESELDPSFRVALLLFDGDLRQLVPFTFDRRQLVAPIEEIYTKPRTRARAVPTIRMHQFLQKLTLCVDAEGTIDTDCIRDSLYEYAGEVIPVAANFINALDGVVRYAEGLDGHKSVLIVGGNVTINPAREAAEAARALYGNMNEITQVEQSLQNEEALRPRLNGVIERAFRNNVSISFLDRTPAPSDVSARQDQQYQPGFRPQTTAYQTAQQDLREIASVTGGSFVASTRVDSGLQQTMSQLEGTYDLTFYLPDNEPLTPRRMRRISVRSARPGVRITHRDPSEGRRGMVDEGAESLGGNIEVGHSVRRAVEGEMADLIPLRFILDPADLGYQESETHAVAQFTINLRLREANGTLLADSYRVLSHSYPLDLWRAGDFEPPVLEAWADAPPGEYLAEALVTVPSRQWRGTLRRLFTAGETLTVEEPESESPETSSDASPAQPRLPSPASVQQELEERDNRPAIAFAQQFLGIVAGSVEIGFLTGLEVAAVDLLLDGEPVGRAAGEPWTATLELGEVPSPHELVAVARDRQGEEIGRVQQWLNLPRPWAELDVVLFETDDRQLMGQIAWTSVGGQRPSELTATLDGAAVDVDSERARIQFPPLDMSEIHLLRVEARFEDETVIRDLALGGRYVQEASAALSSVAVQLKRRGDVSSRDLRIEADGRSVPVVAVERGEADLIVVVDPRALRMFPGLSATPRPGPMQIPSARADPMLTPAQSDVHLRMVWPIVNDSEDVSAGYRLFPSSAPDEGTAPGGLLWHLAGARFPTIEGPVRIADAVAVAGSMALERGRRRAVLLLHGGSRIEGDYTAAAVRSYLEQLRVPLIVWSIGTPTRAVVQDWGAVLTVSTRQTLRDAWLDVIRKLDRQRVVWVEGTWLPQTLESASEHVELAGARRR